MNDEDDLKVTPKGGKKKGKSIGKGLVAGLVITGIILMLAGGIFGHAMDQVWKYPSGDDDKYDGDNDGVPDSASKSEDLDKDQDNFELRRTVDRGLENIGTYFFLFGLVLLIIGFLVGGLMCNDLPDLVRMGMIVAVGFLVYYWV